MLLLSLLLGLLSLASPLSASPLSTPHPTLPAALSYAPSLSLLVSPSPHLYAPAPFSLHPHPVPAAAFASLLSDAHLFPRLCRLACSPGGYASFLRPALRGAAAADPGFTGRLLSLADSLPPPPHPPLLLARGDYMFAAAGPKQIELNTIASSFGCLASRVSELHALLAPSLPLPANGALPLLAAALALAAASFSPAPPRSPLPRAVLFVVQPGESNSPDQHLLELALRARGVRALRRTLAQLSELPPEGGDAVLSDGGGAPHVVAVVYYRAGYSPRDYPGEREWRARGALERGSAVKCPDVRGQLFGCKKVQQVLATERLGELVGDEGLRRRLGGYMAGLWALGRGDGDAVAMALENPGGFVMKPQREGGGNNLYGGEMRDALLAMGEGEREAFVLMELVKPEASPCVLVRDGEVRHDGPGVCEVGVFAASLGEEEVEGEGFLVRVKAEGTEEGGVAAGYAFLSSPLPV
ncbi:hypothetical protein TeGR_g11140 [Tetraparma gracilis]|uniref:Glutathione synthetase n=1 Tax=Tetraparma gracilis TaxID=2962635 RepID=A0ABQ6MY95_9STRA|nr:hypothetical protein TeGR_g11140 [Tetraparma gracilis]